jgi:hypothetical protein
MKDSSQSEWRVPVKTILRLYPELLNKLPFVCKCGKTLKPSHGSIDSDFAGIESVSCDCGIYAHQGTFITRTLRSANKWREIILNKDVDDGSND